MEEKNKKVEYESCYCKVEFTAEELKGIAETLAMKTQELGEIEQQKKSAMSSFKERLERVQGDVTTAARLYKDGFEMRDVECMVERDFEVGEVRYIRTDNGEIARTKKMTMGERQRRIEELQDQQEEAEAPEDSEETNEEIAAKQNIQREMSAETSAL